MILHSVPTEDYDEENSLVTEQPKPRQTKKLSKKQRRISASDHRVSANEEDEVSWKLVALGICCCLGVVATGASLAVLSRLGDDQGSHGTLGDGSVPSKRPLLAIFGLRLVEASEALPSDNAVAWLASRLLSDADAADAASKNAAAAAPGAFGVPEGRPQLLPDGQLVQSWRPKAKVAGRQLAGPTAKRLRAVVVGPIAEILQAQHGLGPPAVRSPGGVSQTAADAFLHIRELIRESSGKASEDGATEAQLVLVSHPHQLPYLSLMAAAAGFRRVAVLDPRLFEGIPWKTFGCSDLGYSLTTDAGKALAQEATRLESYVTQLRETEPERLQRLQALLQKVNATLAFHRCVVQADGSATRCGR